MPRQRVLPPTYFFISMVHMVFLHLVMPVRNLVSYSWNTVGCLPLALGIAPNLVVDAALKKYGTTVKPFQESTALITTGPFSISGHLKYLGMIFILIGIGISRTYLKIT